MRRFFATAAAALALCASFVPAHAQAPATCLTTADQAGTATATFASQAVLVARGIAGCAVSGEQVTISIDLTVLGVVAARADGAYDSTALVMRIPSGTNAGAHTIAAVPNSRRASPYQQTITVTAPVATTASGEPLPSTGLPLSIWLLWAAITLAIGYFLLTATWRYRSEARRVRAMERSGDADWPAVPIASRTLRLEPVGSLFDDEPTPRPPSRAEYVGERVERVDDAFEFTDDAYTPVRSRVATEPKRGPHREPRGAPQRSGPTTEPVRESIARSNAKTADLLAKLRAELESWTDAP